MKVYIAGHSQERAKECRLALLGAGHTVVSDWYAWIDKRGDNVIWTGSDFGCIHHAPVVDERVCGQGAASESR